MEQKTTDVSPAKKPKKSSRTDDPGVGADGGTKTGREAWADQPSLVEPEVKSRSGDDPGVGADGGTKTGKQPTWD